jgi:CheY-like chemotaxis protein
MDLVEVIRDALEVTQPRWRDEPQSRGIVVRVETKLAPLPPVPGNPAELREVLTNLILNALDAMPNGGTLTLTSRADERGVIIEVQDTGIGMTDEVRRRIFDPFFTTKGPKGTGLGLAVVYGIVTRHGGEIQVESREGVGSTFTIRLPYGLIESPPTPEKESTLAAPARVLVIDDEEAVREALRDILSLRHVVEEAASGAEGIDRLKQTRFDLVITDLGMAGMSGWQVARAVKALRPETAVVLVTGWGVQLDPAELRSKGVDRVLPKPFEMMDVFELVASVVGTNGMEGE